MHGNGHVMQPALWQQFLHVIWEELPNKERYKIIVDDILIFSMKEQHWEDLEIYSKSLSNMALRYPAQVTIVSK